MIRIAVLMTCYNRKEKTLDCLQSLFEVNLSHLYSIEVFLVDDNSTDNTSQFVKQRYPQVNILNGDGTLYWNRGMHMAWKAASQKENFDFYVWLNDDVLLFKNAFKILLDSTRKNPDIIICGVMRSVDKEKPTYGGSNSKGALIEPNGRKQLCNVFNGNFVLIPKSVFYKLGNLNFKFRHAIGDYDYALRAKKNGIQAMISTDYVGYCDKHERPPSWCLPEVKLFQRIKNLYSPLGNSHPYYYFLFEKEHYGLLTAIKHFITIHIRLLIPSLWQNK